MWPRLQEFCGLLFEKEILSAYIKPVFRKRQLFCLLWKPVFILSRRMCWDTKCRTVISERERISLHMINKIERKSHMGRMDMAQGKEND